MTNTYSLWYVSAWSFLLITLIVASAWIAICALTAFIMWDLSIAVDGLSSGIAIRTIPLVGGFLSAFFITDPTEHGAKRFWDQATADKIGKQSK